MNASVAAHRLCVVCVYRYEKYVVKDDERPAAGEKGPDPFMDEYAFIMQQADDLTTVRHCISRLAGVQGLKCGDPLLCCFRNAL